MFKLFERLISSPAKRAEHFWTWFAANEEVYRGLHRQPPSEVEHSMKVLLDHLAKVDEALVPYVGPTTNGEGFTFIVSAGGRRELFDTARQLVAAAPELPDWTVSAFKPARRELADVHLGERRLVLDDVRVAQVKLPKEPDALALHVFVPEYVPEDEAVRHGLVALAIEAVIGEEAAGRIDYVNVAGKGEVAPPGVLRPLRGLGRLIEKS